MSDNEKKFPPIKITVEALPGQGSIYLSLLITEFLKRTMARQEINFDTTSDLTADQLDSVRRAASKHLQLIELDVTAGPLVCENVDIQHRLVLPGEQENDRD